MGAAFGLLIMIFGIPLLILTVVYLSFSARNIKSWIKLNIWALVIILVSAWYGMLLPHELFFMFMVVPLIVWSPVYFILAGWTKRWPAVYPMVCCAIIAPITMNLPQTVAYLRFQLYHDDYMEVVETFRTGKWPYEISKESEYHFYLPDQYDHLATSTWDGVHLSGDINDLNDDIRFVVARGSNSSTELNFMPEENCDDQTPCLNGHWWINYEFGD